MAPDMVLPTEANRETSWLRTPDDIVGHVLFERFLIECDLSPASATGGCAIYVAKDLKHFCRKVVIKTLSPAAEPLVRPNAFQEVCEALMRLDHPNIEWMLETGKLFDNRPYVVTTYTSGQSLEQLLQADRRLVLGRVAHIVESVAEGLGAAHARGILHGDITPERIVLIPQEFEAENVRLTGFGFDPKNSSRFESSHFDSKSLLYTAPELMFEDGRATAASDIYSLAAVAYRMLTGKVPFEAADREEMLEKIVRGIRIRPSVLRTDLPLDAEAILLTALQYKPLMRPRDLPAFGLELANELRQQAYPHNPGKKIRAEPPAIRFTDTVDESNVEVPAEERSREPRIRVSHKRPAIVSDRAIAWSLIILLLAGALSIPIGQTILEEGQKPSAVSSIATKPADARLPRAIKYSIEGQSIKDYRSSGSQPILQNNFVNGGEYRMTIEADSAGHAYVLSEAADEQGRTIYKVLYPQSKVNGGSAAIEPKQQVKARPGTVTETGGTEFVWLVWTAGKQDDLETARRSALEADGIVQGENDIQKVKHFLERNKNNKLDIHQNEANQQVVSGFGDRIVYRIEIERS